ncbi:arylesterase [Roseisalinus antarcticus]|uniref:Esterase TesA n=1 Tax=Roseisalinus antarcticus TaxID=254357 RepID=A0A1Y5S149_9RHOB|nr:Esterase TesA precursor [Roseisalinus antarcticus]
MGTFSGLIRSFRYGAVALLCNLALAASVGSAAAAETVTVAALGDSLTQGYGLPQEEGFVPRMEAWLRTEGADVSMINAGVSGDTTAGGLSRVDWTLTPEVDAMIVTLGGNDFLRGIDPAVSRENLRGILEAAEAKEVEVLLVGMQSSNNYGPAFKAAFDSMYPELAEEFDVPLYLSFFGGLGMEGDAAGAAQDLMQADGIHPNAAGVALIVEAMGPAVLQLVNSVR